MSPHLFYFIWHMLLPGHYFHLANQIIRCSLGLWEPLFENSEEKTPQNPNSVILYKILKSCQILSLCMPLLQKQCLEFLSLAWYYTEVFGIQEENRQLELIFPLQTMSLREEAEVIVEKKVTKVRIIKLVLP